MFYELPVEEISTFRERVQAITPDDIQRVARQYIRPDRLSIVLVGNAQAFVSQLRAVGLHRLRGHSDRAARSDVRDAQERAAAGVGQPGRSTPSIARSAPSMRIMISCGEASGDLYAGALAAELHAREPDVEIFGFGGERFEAAGGHLIGDYRGLSVTGLTEALRVVPRSFAMLRRLVDAARECGRTCSWPSTLPTSISGCWPRSGVSASRSSTTSARSCGRGAPAAWRR